MTLKTLTRDDWLYLRRQSIGASEAAAACGESPYLSELELYARKLGMMPDPDLGSIEHVRWGNLLEPAIVEETCRRLELRPLGIEESAERLGGSPDVEIVGALEGRQLFLRSIPHPYMTATLDGIAIDGDGALVSIEAKNTSAWRLEDWQDGGSPGHYQIQVVHQLAVAAPISRGILAGLVGGNALKIAPAMRREDAPIAALIEVERAFWKRVQSAQPPKADGSASSASALKALHPDDNGESITLPLEMIALHEELSQLEDEAKQRSKKIESLRVLLREALGSNTYGILPNGQGRYSYKTQTRVERTQPASKSRVLRFSKAKGKTQ
jgi:predicted phage-related endonuclease